MYAIETDIPVPPRAGRGRPSIYPWAAMKPGDSFLVSDAAKINSVRVNAIKRSKGKTRFLAAKVAEGVRVWRVK